VNKNVFITGGAGFIGCHVIDLFVKKYTNYNIINIDALTYAGNLANNSLVENASNYFFEKVDITNEQQVNQVFEKYQPQAIIHLAAESHVDRSILDPLSFVKTNILGTAILLNACKKYWQAPYTNNLFYHVSTDEVFGSLGPEGFFIETTPYSPRSPYSASKAASDHLVMAYYHTYNLPVVMSNCSNNYGPNQFPEKLLPLMINNIVNNKPLPVYGQGINVRDWLFVKDHAIAIDTIFHKGALGQTYNVGGFNEWKNIDIVQLLCAKMDAKLNRPAGTSAALITYVTDRAGHDHRYAIDASKIKNELQWEPSLQFDEGLDKTIDWYLNNQTWINNITSGNYQNYYQQQYANR
jgi:dTDP-glucose 4,6-dehydratase